MRKGSTASRARRPRPGPGAGECAEQSRHGAQREGERGEVVAGPGEAHGECQGAEEGGWMQVERLAVEQHTLAGGDVQRDLGVGDLVDEQFVCLADPPQPQTGSG
jgi:hypothetical protein